MCYVSSESSWEVVQSSHNKCLLSAQIIKDIPKSSYNVLFQVRVAKSSSELL